jgi:hypothetical protein
MNELENINIDDIIDAGVLELKFIFIDYQYYLCDAFNELYLENKFLDFKETEAYIDEAYELKKQFIF